MGDTQLLIALITPLSTLTIVMVGFLYNNSRMSDLRSELKSDIQVLRSDMLEMMRLHAERLDANLRRVEDMLLGKFAELDNRLSRIEAHLNLH